MSDSTVVVDLLDSCRYIGLGGGKQLQILYLPGDQTILMLYVDSSDMLFTIYQVQVKFYCCHILYPFFCAGLSYYNVAFYRYYSTPAIDNVVCTGNESKLINCSYSYNTNYSIKYSTVGVRCRDCKQYYPDTLKI